MQNSGQKYMDIIQEQKKKSWNARGHNYKIE